MSSCRRSLIAGVMVALLPWPAGAEEPTGIPDFSGRWGRNAFDPEPLPEGPAPLVNLKRLRDGTSDGTALVGDYNNPILKPDAAEIVRQRGLISLSGNAFPDPSNQCAPYSPPYLFTIQLGMEILQEKDQITILYNQDDQVRRVRLNDSHPHDVKPSPMGDSVGHYEGDTLVIDTVGVKVGPLTMADRLGAPQSEAMHLVERYRLIDAAQAAAAQERHERTNGRVGGALGAMPVDPTHGKGLELIYTVEDPKVFTTPWSAKITYRRSRVPWQEQVCAENTFEYYAGKHTAVPEARTPDF